MDKEAKERCMECFSRILDGVTYTGSVTVGVGIDFTKTAKMSSWSVCEPSKRITITIDRE